MTKVSYQFTDVVSGKMVYLWIDNYKEEWLAGSQFGFRCKK